MWNLSSPTGTEATPCTESQSLNHWTAREVPPGHFRAVKTETHKGGVIWAKLPGGRGIALSNMPQGSKIATCQKRVGALKAHETCYIHCEHKSQLFILGIRSRAKFSPQEGKKKIVSFSSHTHFSSKEDCLRIRYLFLLSSSNTEDIRVWVVWEQTESKSSLQKGSEGYLRKSICEKRQKEAGLQTGKRITIQFQPWR